MAITNNTTGKVTVIGLGSLGSVLARTLLDKEYEVTVWNRSAEKAASLVKDGAILAPTAAAAISASPVIITCVSDYKVTRNTLGADEVAKALAGHTVVEFSTGTPQDARDAEVWMHEQGVDYIDGALLATPRQIGKPDTPILVSGNTAVYQKIEPLLKVLGGNLMYMGEPVGLASAWDLAILSNLFGLMTGFIQGARIFESEGISVKGLGSMIANIAPVLGGMVVHEAEVIETGNFGQPESSLKICAFSIELMIKQAREGGINAEIPMFILSQMKKGLDAGLGEEALGSLIKVMRDA